MSRFNFSLPEGTLGLDRKGCIHGSGDRILCAVALDMTLSIEAGDTPEVRDGMLRTLERFEACAGQKLRFGMHPDTGQPEDLGAASASEYVRRWSSDVFDRFELQMLFSGGPHAGDASPLRFLAVSHDREPGQLSFVSLSLPLAWTEQHSPAEFASFVRETCELVRPSHGYAGFAAIAHLIGFDGDSVKPLFDLARQFPGLDLDLPSEHEPFLESSKRIKGVNWLTVLGDAWLERAGGPTIVPGLEAQGITPHHFRGGIVLQAGPEPVFGNEPSPLALDPYRRVARALTPILTTSSNMMFVPDGDGGFDRQESQAWVTRFLTQS